MQYQLSNSKIMTCVPFLLLRLNNDKKTRLGFPLWAAFASEPFERWSCSSDDKDAVKGLVVSELVVEVDEFNAVK